MSVLPTESAPSQTLPSSALSGTGETAIRQVGTTLRLPDRTGAWKARWGISRMHYRIDPGLFAVGTPTEKSPVLVTANYKMSFDRLRSCLTGVDAWILVLDTKGINVWCAAGKGTFGTDEIVRRIEATGLKDAVSHRTVIVPQLGAPGVAAHEVKQRTGFRVVFGPVRSEDVPAFLAAGSKATPEMRRVCFPLRDRLAVAPVELILSARYALILALALLLAGGLEPAGYSWSLVATTGVWSAGLLLVIWLASIWLTPALLPWLPGRAFSVKGSWLGLALLAVFLAGGGWRFLARADPLSTVAWCLFIPTATSFLAMNFTGASTYTSLSGVRKEVAIAWPIQAFLAAISTVIWLIGRFA